MTLQDNYRTTRIYYKFKPELIVASLLIINFLIRIFVYYNTKIFYFSEYSVYLDGIDNIARGEKQYLLKGNYLFAISYIGYFAKYILGDIDYFFVFNCLTATFTSLILYILINKVTGLPLAGIIVIIIHTFYTEFLMFSSVFYTPVIMIFLLSLIILLIWYFITSKKIVILISSGIGIFILFLLTFFFKPELKYLPYFLIGFSIFLIWKERIFFYKINGLAISLIFAFLFFNKAEVISHPPGNVISNSFVFFGHTDYGGDGGEGAFIYSENKVRYEAALIEYSKANNIVAPTSKDCNAFQKQEIKKFITQHTIKWIGLQLTKFFRTFGVVPETTSFKILYSGLFKGYLWLTSVFIVAPVVIIIFLSILFFNVASIKKLFNPSTLHPFSCRSIFLLIYLILFIYYIIATIFYGQYQERYRLPVMVVFIIPVLSYLIAKFDKKQLLKRTGLVIKGSVIVLFLAVWVCQAKRSINNKERLINVIESIEAGSKNELLRQTIKGQ